jgi:hypothetical protein
MDAVKTEYGVFFIFWFRDDTVYGEPKNYASPKALRQKLLEVATFVTPRIVEVIVVDVTPKPSASKR